MNILFLCTQNSARSIMAESILNSMNLKDFIGYSAGSMPSGVINEKAIKILKENNIYTENLYSKSIDDLLNKGIKFDILITLCSSAKKEGCPTLSKNIKSVHWDLDDPIEYNDFEKIFIDLSYLIKEFTSSN